MISVSRLKVNRGLSPIIVSPIIVLLGAGIGAITDGQGGAALGATVAHNGTTFNYLSHKRTVPAKFSEKELYENAVSECNGGAGSASACQTQKELTELSATRDRKLNAACDGSNPTMCNTLVNEAMAMGNLVQGTNGIFVYANSPETGAIRYLNTATIGTPRRPDSFNDQVSKSTAEGLVAAGVVSSSELLVTAGLSKPIVGAVIGGGFDAIGQLTDPKNEPYRPWQTAVNAATGAVALPLGGKSLLLDGILGATTNATNTAVTNAVYGRNDSVQDAAFWGGAFGALGNKAGNWAENTSVSSGLVPRVIYPNGINPRISILLQGALNPLPGYVNTATSATVGGIPTLFPSWMPPSPLSGGKQP